MLRINDGKPDPWGNLWAGTCTLAEQGPPRTLYKREPGRRRHHAIRRHRPVPTACTGPEDRKTLHFADSYGGGADAFDTAPDTGALGAPACASPTFPAGCPTA